MTGMNIVATELKLHGVQAQGDAERCSLCDGKSTILAVAGDRWSSAHAPIMGRCFDKVPRSGAVWCCGFDVVGRDEPLGRTQTAMVSNASVI